MLNHLSIDWVMKKADATNSPEVVTKAISTKADTNFRFRCEPRIPRRRSATSFQKLRVTRKPKITIRITVTAFRNRNSPESPTPWVQPVIGCSRSSPPTADISTTPIQNSRIRRRRSAGGSPPGWPEWGSG